VLGTDGNFYGTTFDGGLALGSVFKLTPSGSLTGASFGFGNDSFLPQSTVTEGVDGRFYGTTWAGGSFNFGSIYKLSLDGSLTTLYSFGGGSSDGGLPYDQLVQGPDGAFYGTSCGTSPVCGSARPGFGAIFKITSAGVFTLLHTFGGFDGEAPKAGLVLGPDGYFYGTTTMGGIYNKGTVFKMNASGGVTNLENFDGSNGAAPIAPLFLATDGNFYGTTSIGGSTGGGTIFQITPQGTLTTLYNFNGPPADGASSWGGLLQATDGKFYGVTAFGGNHRQGVVYSLDTGLGPFVGLSPRYGTPGRTIGILGYGLTGTAGVSFNGIPAEFTTDSDTFLTVTVPPGATTGPVQVVTPSGTLTSNVNFQVMP
jgi:uncharacterized repeat protein (TIGR03803 family)